MAISLTDAETRFADSAAGKAALARAKMTHDMQDAWRGPAARPWTDAMEAAATRDLAARDARQRVESVAFDAALPAQLADARVAADAARVAMVDRMTNAWRKPA